jgi:hypothetical protein
MAFDTPGEPPRSPEAQAKLDKWLGGRIAGERRTCLPVGKTNDPIGVDDRTVLFRDGPRIWRNDLRASSGCDKLGKQYAMITQSAADRLCSGSQIAVVDMHDPTVAVGGCELGDFVLYQKP